MQKIKEERKGNCKKNQKKGNKNRGGGIIKKREENKKRLKKGKRRSVTQNWKIGGSRNFNFFSGRRRRILLFHKNCQRGFSNSGIF